MVHNHSNVIWRESVLIEWLLILVVVLLLGLNLRCLSWWLLLSELLGLLLLHLLVHILELQLSEDRVRVVKVENLGVVDHEDEAVSLLEGHSGDASEGFHALLHEGLSALLLSPIE